jgi:hypothetical protein
MDQIDTSVMLTTFSHRVMGRVVTGGQRLHDVINNKLNTCLNLFDVTIFRHTDAERPAAHFSTVTVPKSLIHLALVQEQKHEAPTKRLYGFVAKNTYPTFLTVAGYEVQGSLHFTSLPKPELFLTDTSTSFIPVSQATVVSVADPTTAWEATVVFAQRAAIATFQLGEER